MMHAGTLAACVSEPAPVALPLTDTRKQGTKVNVCWELESVMNSIKFCREKLPPALLCQWHYMVTAVMQPKSEMLRYPILRRASKTQDS